MSKLLTQCVPIDTRYDIEGLTPNEFLAWAAELVQQVPVEYRDTAKAINVGYDEPRFEFQWERPQTESERQKEELERAEEEARRRAHERALFERLKAKFEPTK